MNVFEKFAVEQFLYCYPENVSLAQLFLMLRECDEEVEVWQPFFDAEPEEIIEAITNMIDALQDTFVPKENLYRKNPQYTDIISDGGMDPRV